MVEDGHGFLLVCSSINIWSLFENILIKVIIYIYILNYVVYQEPLLDLRISDYPFDIIKSFLKFVYYI